MKHAPIMPTPAAPTSAERGRGRAKRRLRIGFLVAAGLAAGGCVGAGREADPAERYTISLARPNQPLSGGLVQSLVTDRGSSRAEVERVLGANPGLREALVQSGVDIRRVAALRIGPDNVVEVFTRAFE